MSRDEVMQKVREHIWRPSSRCDPERIKDETRFREDLDADSLDLYELVMELEDTYGVRVSEEEAARIETVGQAVDFVARARSERLRDGQFGPGSRSRGAPDDPTGRRSGAGGAGRRAAGGAAAPGADPFLVGRAPRRVLRAACVPRRQRARPGGRRGALPALSAQRHRAADQGPRTARSADGRASRWPLALGLPEPLREARARGRGRDLPGGADLQRAGAGVGRRGGDRRLLSGARIRAHLGGDRARVRGPDRARAARPCWTSSPRCRRSWRAEARP